MLEKVTAERDELLGYYQCQFGCGELGYPIVYMGDGALYCGSCMSEEE